MKIGIITFHNVNNYGSVLQTYATQETFRKLGWDTEIIDYCREDQVSYYAKMKTACDRSSFGKNKVLRMLYYGIKAPSYFRQKCVFRGFLDKYISVGKKRYLSYKALLDSPPCAEVFCTGSDQMWNSEYNNGVEKAYYLEFAQASVPRIAYSTSIGMANIPETEVDETRTYLKKYRAISVREESAKIALNDIGIENVQHVLDPTLVLTGDDWRKIASKKYKKHKPYVLIYQLNPNPEFDSFAENLAKEHGCDLLRINLLYDQFTRTGKSVCLPTVNEYISLFDNAMYVVTDSFHGTAFCLNLNKQFFVFYPPKYGTRLESILRLTNQMDRVVQGRTVPESAIDYEYVNKILARERKRNVDFLQGALQNKNV